MNEPSVGLDRNLSTCIDELRDFDTALVANTLGYVDPTPAHELYMGGTIHSVTPSLGPTVGIAITCEMDSSSPGGETQMDLYWQQVEQMAERTMPLVWVVKAVGSRPDHECVIGDGMAKTLYASGCIGLVSDGGVRDVQGLLSVPFAAYCRGRVIHHCALRIRSINRPVELGGITVRTGDLIHATDEGVIRVPALHLESLPARCARMRVVEHEVHRVWRRTDVGVSEKRRWAGEVFAKNGFTRGAGSYGFIKGG